MAHFTQEKKKEVAPAIKAVLKRYNVKGTIAIRNHSTLVVNLNSGKLDLIGLEKSIRDKRAELNNDEKYDLDNFSINEYHASDSARKHGNNEIANFYEDLIIAMKSVGHYNNSNAMIDYFDVAYYMTVNVGRWNKPYKLLK